MIIQFVIEYLLLQVLLYEQDVLIFIFYQSNIHILVLSTFAFIHKTFIWHDKIKSILFYLKKKLCRQKVKFWKSQSRPQAVFTKGSHNAIIDLGVTVYLTLVLQCIWPWCHSVYIWKGFISGGCTESLYHCNHKG